ncbi:hypothetical protein CRE_02591 [Caenorhabditis remanei]|uniref:G-protein coupled receptors family 1 profile domain-containing protein n=1 Tax=Caenorhabditis remanei TaxID=31234 RepID=E3N9T8_CAERE|nr:hypothetical protein CRE_02591 [Caenorhabditis remanei]
MPTHLNITSTYDSHLRIYLFGGLQGLDTIFSVLYCIAVLVLQCYNPFFIMVAVLCFGNILRSTFTFCTIISWCSYCDQTILNLLNLYVDHTFWNFQSGMMLLIAIHRFMDFSYARISDHIFSQFLAFLLTSWFFCSIALAMFQIKLGKLQRDMFLEHGWVDVRMDDCVGHFVAMKIPYLFPIFTIIVFIIFFYHYKKVPKHQVKFKDIPGERNTALLIILIMTIQTTLRALYDHKLHQPLSSRFNDHPYDITISMASFLPEILVPLFLFTSISQFQERVSDYKTPTLSTLSVFQ